MSSVFARRASAEGGFSQLLKTRRQKRRLSQLELALTSGVSQRHVRSLESVRAKPSRSMILQLSETLEVPLRDRNDWLTAAGFEDAALVPVLPVEMAKGGVRMFFLGDRDLWYGAGRHRR